MGTDLPPIRAMREEEVYWALWEAPDSLKENLLEVLRSMEDGP